MFLQSFFSALMCWAEHWFTFASSLSSTLAWMTVCFSALTMALLMPSTMLSALSLAASRALKAVRSRWTVCFKLPCMSYSSSFRAWISFQQIAKFNHLAAQFLKQSFKFLRVLFQFLFGCIIGKPLTQGGSIGLFHIRYCLFGLSFAFHS